MNGSLRGKGKKRGKKKLDAKWNTIFARGCKALGFNVICDEIHEVTQIRWMAFQNGRTRTRVMPPRTDRPLDIAPLHSIPPPPPPPSPFALLYAFLFFFFLRPAAFLSFPTFFLSSFFSFRYATTHGRGTFLDGRKRNGETGSTRL